MKRSYFYVCCFLLCLSACKKDYTKNEGLQKSSTVSFMDADKIPNEIIPLLYKDLINDKLYEQAKLLSESYYKTLLARTDSKVDLLGLSHGQRETAPRGATFSSHSVSGVGVVLNGNWYETSGATSANLQTLGWVSINFNVMNASAPDAFDNTAPGSTQIMGTVGQSRRLEAFTLPYIQFGAPDNLGTTYYTGSFGFTYAAYVQDIGWQSYVSSSATAGTVGQSKRIEAVKIYGPRYTTPTYTVTFNDASPSTQARPYIYYRVQQENYGWESWVSENVATGITGLAKRIEAMQVRAYLIKI